MPMHLTMASHASNKKVALKSKKASVTKTAKTSKRKATGKASKANTKKTAVNNQVTVKKTAKKKTAAKRKPTQKKVSKAAVKSASMKMADLDATKAKKSPTTKVAKPARANAPQTPSVPRIVKPTPKVVDVETDPEVMAFIDAIDKYKTEYCRPFPSWREVYYVFKQLGYERRFLRW